LHLLEVLDQHLLADPLHKAARAHASCW
jgi:hypothetical protein